jgi:acetyl esterase/lipase
VRNRADKWKIDVKRVGVVGFSAGGHLASTVSTHYDMGWRTDDPIDRNGCRPDFTILAYAVISMDENMTHGGSRRNLLGENPDPEMVKEFSNELQVTKETPPTFLFSTADDGAVPVANSIAYFQALRKNNVPAELHVFETGRHGLGLAPNVPGASDWPDLCIDWMKRRDLLKAKAAE